MSPRLLWSLVGLAVVADGCVRVAPYQRGHMADPAMEVGHENAESGFRAHVHDSREGATGGYGSTGGGCGCN